MKFLDVVTFHVVTSHSQYGAVALYVKSGLIPTPRCNLGKGVLILRQFGLKFKIEMVRIICSVVFIVIQAMIMIILVSICMKFCPIQLYLINKPLPLVTSLNYNSHTPVMLTFFFLFLKQLLPYIVYPSGVSENRGGSSPKVFQLNNALIHMFPTFRVKQEKDSAFGSGKGCPSCRKWGAKLSFHHEGGGAVAANCTP